MVRSSPPHVVVVFSIAVTAVLNIEGAEEEGGSLFNTAGKLVSAHRAHGIHPIYGVYPIFGVEKRRKRGARVFTPEMGFYPILLVETLRQPSAVFPPLKWDFIPF